MASRFASHLLRRALALAALLVATLPAAARADFFPGDTIDGPASEIVGLGDVDVAHDGTGGLVYVKKDGGTDHIFVSRLVDGAWTGPERLDAGLGGVGSQPVIAASDGGRLVVAFVSAGVLHAMLRPRAGDGWSAPMAIAGGASNPSIDMSIHGVAYVSFTTGGGSADVRAARLDRTESSFVLLGQPLDLDAGRDAGDGPVKRSRVSVSADGTAVAAWGESGGDGRTHVISRRLYGANVSTAPQDLTLGSFEGRGGGSADSPEIQLEYDSSFGWAVFRQSFDDGGSMRSRVVARRLLGSNFEAPVAVDGLGFGGAEGAETPRLDMNGIGQGIAAAGSQVSNQTFAAVLDLDVFNPGQQLSSAINTVAPNPQPAIGHNGDSVVAWQQRGGPTDVTSIQARGFIRGRLTSEATLARLEFGAADPTLGFAAAASRLGDTAVGFVQGGLVERRIVVGGYDRAPSQFLALTSQRLRGLSRPLVWQPSVELWGPVTYRVEVDGVPIGTTTATRLATAPGQIRDGAHRWRVVAIDRRGQETATPSRILQIDATPPRLRLTITGTRKRGRALRFSLRVADVLRARPSGVASTTIDFGDRSRRSPLRRVSHRYRRSGTYLVRATARDKAGNVTRVERTVRIKR